jgi:excisionase family DNA binding protein
MNGNLTALYPRPALRVPGYLSVRAAAERLGIRERSVRELIARRRLASSRLGRLHFLAHDAVEAYRGERRERARRARRRHAAPGQRRAA